MKKLIALLSLGALHPGLALDSKHWPLETADPGSMTLHGKVKTAPGAVEKSLVLDGRPVIELKDTMKLNPGEHGFTFSVWFNPYHLNRGQQVIAAKNRYSSDERQWSLTVEADGTLRAYLHQGGWKTISTQEKLKAGHWHQVTLTVHKSKALLYLNGQPVGETSLTRPLMANTAPITLGGVNDLGSLRQQFMGALDEVRYTPTALTPAEVASRYQPASATHDIPQPLAAKTPLWDEKQTLGKSLELPLAPGTRFSVIKPYEFTKDGYRFLHGVGLAFHKGKLYASFGHNKGAENTDTEEARYCVSEDLGRTWSPVATMDRGEPGTGISHGSFLSHQGQLWAFMGAYTGFMKDIHTRAYVLDETTQTWQAKGTVIEGGFWPMQEPLKMADGNWIMAGIRVAKYLKPPANPAAVAISHGDDLTKWDLVVIPAPDGLDMWGESTVFVSGKRITNVSRYGGERKALIAISEDYGRTWTESLPSNLPMITSKPYAGTLSTGQHYLVCTTSADVSMRSPLTIALTRPGENVFSRVLVIRHAEFPEGPGESHPKAALSYPYAVEHEGHLYVGYSNTGGKVGRVGEGRELANNNSAELAVIPLEALKVEAGD
ncbi:LamG-like jellyroll fold domain-containing protein [Prosthecobacter sp. SYSU 5D2]|uniref:LamG-like jellyroll fold domain-containing protein n=1 Tax=Prosthecobacter sp. SYSU 5D2 TaxID=3134134 RepID=UPI0031FF2E22